MAWGPDHKTFYYIDTPAFTVVAFDFDQATGEISNLLFWRGWSRRFTYYFRKDGTGRWPVEKTTPGRVLICNKKYRVLRVTGIRIQWIIVNGQRWTANRRQKSLQFYYRLFLWRIPGSNRSPLTCHASALPDELIPRKELQIYPF